MNGIYFIENVIEIATSIANDNSEMFVFGIWCLSVTNVNTKK